MRKYKRLFGVGVVGIVMACAAAHVSAVTATRGPIKKDETVLDENGIFLENEYLKVGIVTIGLAGQVKSFVYKPTGHELAGQEVVYQGLCTDRMGEDRWFWRHACPSKPKERLDFCPSGYRSKIVSQDEGKAVAWVEYTWYYDYGDLKTTVLITKEYTLEKGSAALSVKWSLKNTGDKPAGMTPWVKHCGRKNESEQLLLGPSLIMQEQGPVAIKHEATVNVVANWRVRLSGTTDSEVLPMFCSMAEFKKMFRHFEWVRGERFKNETIFRRIQLNPGQEWSLTYVVNAVANLGDVSYVASELAASLETVGQAPAVGRESRVKVKIAPAILLGARRLEGEIATFDGKLVVKLPNREVNLIPGRISSADYTFTPPANGVYNIVLSVFEDQTPMRLGKAVNSQQRNIVLPLVVGPTPEVVVKKWQGGDFAWPRREAKETRLWRTLVNDDRLKIGQARVPERIFPEDKITFSSETEPGYARLAKGEYEDIQFVVDFARGGDVMDVEVSLSPIKNKAGLPLQDVQLREVVYLTTENPSGYRTFPVGEWPDPLFALGWQKKIPNAPLTKRNVEACRKSKRRTFFIIARAPRQGAAGEYKGTVTLKIAGKPVSSFPVVFAVDDFALLKRAHYRCSTGMVGFGARKWANNAKIMGLSEEEIAAVENEKGIIDRYRELNLEYGWTPVMWSGPAFWKKYYDYGRGVNFFSGAGQKDVPWLKEKGLLKYAFVYAPFDEHTDALVPKVAAWCREWKKKCDVPILDCYYGGNVEPLFGLVDIWLGQTPNQDWARERKKHGDQFIGCNQSLQWYLEFMPVVGRAEFWDYFQTGYDGHYIYSTCRWTDDIYKENWSVGGNYVGCVTYPSPDGISTSIRFESLRDGIEDYDYLAILRKLIKEKESTADKAVLKDARELLRNPKLLEKVKTIDGMYEMRDKVATLIEKLK